MKLNRESKIKIYTLWSFDFLQSPKKSSEEKKLSLKNTEAEQLSIYMKKKKKKELLHVHTIHKK